MEDVHEAPVQGYAPAEKPSDVIDIRSAVGIEDKSSCDGGCHFVIGDSFSSPSAEKTFDHQAARTDSKSSCRQETNMTEAKRREVSEEWRELGDCVQQRDSGCYSPTVEKVEISWDAAILPLDIRTPICSLPLLEAKDVGSLGSTGCKSVFTNDGSELSEPHKSTSPADFTSGDCVDNDGQKERLSLILRNSEDTELQVPVDESIREKEPASSIQSVMENRHHSLQSNVDDEALCITSINDEDMREADGLHDPKEANICHSIDTDDVSSLTITKESTLSARTHSTDEPKPAGEIIQDTELLEIDATGMTDGSTSNSSSVSDASQQVHASAGGRKSNEETEQRSFSESLNNFTSEFRQQAVKEDRGNPRMPAAGFSRSNKRKIEPQSSCDSHFQTLRSKSEYQKDMLSMSGRVFRKPRPSNKWGHHYPIPSGHQKEEDRWKACAVIGYPPPSHNTAPNPEYKNFLEQQRQNYDMSLSLRTSPEEGSVIQKPVLSGDSSISFQCLTPFDRWANKTMSALELGALRIGSNFVMNRCCIVNTDNLLEELCKFLLNSKSDLDRGTRFLKLDKVHKDGNMRRRYCTLQADCVKKGIRSHGLTLSDADCVGTIGKGCCEDASNASQYTIPTDFRLLRQDGSAGKLTLNNGKRKYCDVSKANDGHFKDDELGDNVCSNDCREVVQKARCPLLDRSGRALETNLDRCVLAFWQQRDLWENEKEESQLLGESESRVNQRFDRMLLRKRKGCHIRRVANKSTLNLDIGVLKESIDKLTCKDFEQDCLSADNVQSAGTSILSDLKNLISKVCDIDDAVQKASENLHHGTASTRLSADEQGTQMGKENNEVKYVKLHTEAKHAVTENIDKDRKICKMQKRAKEGGIIHATAASSEEEERTQKKSEDKNPSTDVTKLKDWVLSIISARDDLQKVNETLNNASGSASFSSSLALQRLPSPTSQVPSGTELCFSFQCELKNEYAGAGKEIQDKAEPSSNCAVVCDILDSKNLHLSNSQSSEPATGKENQQNYNLDRMTLHAQNNISVHDSSDCEVDPELADPSERKKRADSSSKPEAAFPECSQDVSKSVGFFPVLALKNDELHVCPETDGKLTSRCPDIDPTEPVAEPSAVKQDVSVLDEDAMNKRMCLRGVRSVNKTCEDSKICDCSPRSQFLKELDVDVSGSFSSSVLGAERLAGNCSKMLPKIDTERIKEQGEWKSLADLRQGSDEDKVCVCGAVGIRAVADQWSLTEPHLKQKTFVEYVRQGKTPNSRYEELETVGISSSPQTWELLQTAKEQPTKATSFNNPSSHVSSRSRILQLAGSSFQNVAEVRGFGSSSSLHPGGSARCESVRLGPVQRAITKKAQEVSSPGEDFSHAGGHEEAKSDGGFLAGDCFRPAQQEGRTHQNPPSVNDSLASSFQHLVSPMMSLTNSREDREDFPSVHPAPNTRRSLPPHQMLQPPANLGTQHHQQQEIHRQLEVFPSFYQSNPRPLPSLPRGSQQTDRQLVEQRLHNFNNSEAWQSSPGPTQRSCSDEEVWKNIPFFMNWNTSDLFENPLTRSSPFTINLNLSIWSPGSHLFSRRDWPW